MMVNGHSKDIKIVADGTLNEVEEQLAFNSLPSNDTTALNCFKWNNARCTQGIQNMRPIAVEAGALVVRTRRI